MSHEVNYFDPPITPKEKLFNTYFNPKLVLVMDEVLQDMGYKYICTFDKMKPNFIKL